MQQRSVGGNRQRSSLREKYRAPEIQTRPADITLSAYRKVFMDPEVSAEYSKKMNGALGKALGPNRHKWRVLKPSELVLTLVNDEAVTREVQLAKATPWDEEFTGLMQKMHDRMSEIRVKRGLSREPVRVGKPQVIESPNPLNVYEAKYSVGVALKSWPGNTPAALKWLKQNGTNAQLIDIADDTQVTTSMLANGMHTTTLQESNLQQVPTVRIAEPLYEGTVPTDEQRRVVKAIASVFPHCIDTGETTIECLDSYTRHTINRLTIDSEAA